MDEKVWMKLPGGDPVEIECGPDTTSTLGPLMVSGWRQCDPPTHLPKEKE